MKYTSPGIQDVLTDVKTLTFFKTVANVIGSQESVDIDDLLSAIKGYNNEAIAKFIKKLQTHNYIRLERETTDSKIRVSLTTEGKNVQGFVLDTLVYFYQSQRD